MIWNIKETISRKFGLEINQAKLKIMIIDRWKRLAFDDKASAGDDDVVDNVIYLGSITDAAWCFR